MSSFNLDDEKRGGYLVKSSMKKVWAVEMDLITHFVDYCQANGLRCWAEGGTLLGAVRHKGFIPWDDDVDFVMLRDDYDRMCRETGNKGIEPPYFLQTAFSDVEYHRPHAQFRRSDTAAIRPSDCFQPFNQGIFIDIFPLDNVPDNHDKLMETYKFSRKIFRFLKAKNTHCIASGRLSLVFRKIKAIHDVRKYGWINIYEKAEDALRSLWKLPGSKVAQVSVGELGKLYDKHIFDETVWLPFENITVPAPKGYEAYLRAEFGDNYMTPIQAPNAHGSLVFDTEHSYTELLPRVRRQYRLSAFLRLWKKLFKK